MKRILLDQIDNQFLSNLPEENGVICFWKGSELLYSTFTVNLRYTLRLLFARQEEDENIKDLLSQAELLEIEETNSGLDALMRDIQLKSRQEVTFSQRIQLWKNYVYLAINPAEFPFVKIAEYSDEDWFYIGPFRSRFFLADVIELMQKLLKLPFCEVKEGPCEKAGEEMCREWCSLIKVELNRREEEAKHPNLEKLDALLKEAYVHPDNKLIDLISREKQKYDNKLEFTKGDFLNSDLKLLTRYREWLIFLYQIKNLNKVTENVVIKGGQLIRFKIGTQLYEKPYIHVKYRPNEILALNKNLLDEARILYKECQ